MSFSRQPSCRQAKARKGPCPHLVNGRQCHSTSCKQNSYHDAHQISWWKQNAGKSRCQKGPNCTHLQTRTCLWTHPPEEQAQLALLKELMTYGLRYKGHLNLRSLKPSQAFVGITDHQDLASFNKVSGTEIAVPGSPPRFTPLSQTLDVECDATNKSLCFNFPRYTHPFEPLLRSIEIMAPNVDIFESAEVVSNASNLRKLFHILSHKTMRAERYDIEMRGNTMLLSRWNEDPSLNDSLGHGAGFERQTCRYTPDDDAVLHRSMSHHRVVSYRFAGLRCVVQSEVDAYYCDCDHSDESPAPIPIPSGKKGRSTLSPLAAPFTPASSPPTSAPTRKHSVSGSPPKRPELAFASLTLDDPGDSPTFAAAQLDVLRKPPTPPPDSSSPVVVHRCGRDVPSTCLLEVKTHKAGGNPMFTPEAQLYFSRRTKLYNARYYDKGRFVPGPDLKVQDRTGALRVWEREEQATLRKLGALLRLVREKAKEMAGRGIGRVSLVCQSVDEEVKVELYERGGGPSLVPDDFGRSSIGMMSWRL
ncbi:hypothetical protein MFIFM68171_11262 [Madurella fahalii]|uniref:Uncharacterized protein n=1 Tax=Madurella fahalii TaxID=1157608 RepID=A0ABQ0GTI0_9PEZI